MILYHVDQKKTRKYPTRNRHLYGIIFEKMKITFTASLRGKKDFEAQYDAILSELKKNNEIDLSEGLLTQTSGKAYTDVQKGNREANIALYKKKIEELRHADFCIFECSAHSLTIGFMIHKALEMNKPTIVLYYKDNDPEFLAGVEDDKLIIKSYDDENLPKILKDAFDAAQDVRDKRFNFFISPNLLTFLESTSRDLGVTKSTFIRNLILEHKKKQK